MTFQALGIETTLGEAIGNVVQAVSSKWAVFYVQVQETAGEITVLLKNNVQASIVVSEGGTSVIVMSCTPANPELYGTVSWENPQIQNILDYLEEKAK